MNKEKIAKKAEELIIHALQDSEITMWELLGMTSADGFTLEEAYTLFMLIDKAWYGVNHFWKQNVENADYQDITPNDFELFAKSA